MGGDGKNNLTEPEASILLIKLVKILQELAKHKSKPIPNFKGKDRQIR